MRKVFIGLLAALGLTMGLVATAPAQAVMPHGSGLPTTTHLSGGVSVTEVQKPALKKTADGTIKRFATGSTTAWWTHGGSGCGNYFVSWDDLGAGSSWEQTGASTWNASNNAGCPTANFAVKMKGPSAATPGVCGSDCNLSPGQTSTLGTDYTGTGTSVATWDHVQGVGCSRFYVIPGGTDHVIYPAGHSVCP